MQNDFNRPTHHKPLGKGVFRPSRAAIAAEMEARLRLGNSGANRRPAQPTSSRH